MAVVPVTCVACKLPFDKYEAGSLLCFWHPGKLATSTKHLDCCGISTNPISCSSHLESEDGTPKGCHRADHSATEEERESYKTRPYSICPLSEVKHMPHIATSDNKMVFHYENVDSMPARLSIRVPDTWGAGKALTQGFLHIDLTAEQEKLQIAMYGSSATLDPDDDPYNQQWAMLNDEEQEEEAHAFVPFVLFLRVDPDIDPGKKRDIDSFVKQRKC